MEHSIGQADGETPPNSWSRRAREAANKYDYKQAQAICQQAAGESELAGRDREASVAHHRAGMYAYRQGDLEEAETSYRRSLAIDKHTGDEQGSARTLNNLSAVANERGDHDEAIDFLIESIRIKEKLGDDPGVAASYHQLGIVASARGDLVAAEDWYQHSLAAKGTLGDDHGMAASYLALHLVAGKAEDHEGSQAWLSEAMQALDRLGDVNATINLGRYAERLELPDNAFALYRKATELAKAQDDEEKYVRSYQYFGALAGKTGDYETARECFERALAIEERAGRDEGIAYNRRWLEWLDDASSSGDLL